MRKFFSPLAFIALLLALSSVPASSDETGLASMHPWRKVGKKTCMTDHSHSGSGVGPTQKIAEAKTIASWRSFTDLEYGSTWADFRLAVDKSMRCGRTASEFKCDVEATACRPF